MVILLILFQKYGLYAFIKFCSNDLKFPLWHNKLDSHCKKFIRWMFLPRLITFVKLTPAYGALAINFQTECNMICSLDSRKTKRHEVVMHPILMEDGLYECI